VDLPARPEGIDAAWLRSALGLPAGQPASVRAERIGEGFGLDGIVVRLHLEGAPGLPATLVAKSLGASKAEREDRFYTEFAPRLDIALPRFHGRFADDAGERAILILGDIHPARQGDVLVGLSPREAAGVVAVAATCHATFWDRGEEPPLASLPPWCPDPPAEAARTAERIPAFLAGWGDRIPPAARALTEDLPARLPAAQAALAEAPRTLVHSDLHADNVLLPPAAPPVLLDWPDACRGPAAVDFGHFLIEGITPDVRRAEEERLTAHWVGEAAGRGVTGYGVDRLRADTRHAQVLLWGGIVTWAARLRESPSAQPRKAAVLENLVRNGAAALADRA
jgi:hypothetical protein